MPRRVSVKLVNIKFNEKALSRSRLIVCVQMDERTSSDLIGYSQGLEALKSTATEVGFTVKFPCDDTDTQSIIDCGPYTPQHPRKDCNVRCLEFIQAGHLPVTPTSGVLA